MLDVNMDHLTNIINLDYMLRITIAVIFGFCLGLGLGLKNFCIIFLETLKKYK